MQIQVHTDNHIHGGEHLTQRVQDEVAAALHRFADVVTRVEVQLHDLNAHKGGVDKRCLMEARIASHAPHAVSHDSDNLDLAIAGALEKLEKVLDHIFDRESDKKGRTSFGGDQKI